MTNLSASWKRQAGEIAAELVGSGTTTGLGTGSMAIFASRRVAERLHSRELGDVVAVATSRVTDAAARALGIPMLTDDVPRDVDLTIDGADEVDPALDLIEGGGGALLRGKIVAQASRREVIVVDGGKLSPTLGIRRALPVEVLDLGWGSQTRFLASLGALAELRRSDGVPYRTDGGNTILDCRFGPIGDVAGLARVLDGRAGIVAHGLFVGLARDVIVAGTAGVRHLRRDDGRPVRRHPPE